MGGSGGLDRAGVHYEGRVRGARLVSIVSRCGRFEVQLLQRPGDAYALAWADAVRHLHGVRCIGEKALVALHGFK